MRTLRIPMSFFVLVVASFALTSFSAEEKKKNAPEWAELFGGASLPLVWQSASAASEKIAAALAARKLDGVADWAETIHVASHALEAQVKLADGERAKRLKGALEQAAKIADDVLDGANHNEPAETAEAYRRLASALTLAKIRLPKEIVDAPPQELRFAKAAGHAHDGKGEHVQKK